MATYKDWLIKASDDLKWTKHSIESKVWYGACFTSQQSAEKASTIQEAKIKKNSRFEGLIG